MRYWGGPYDGELAERWAPSIALPVKAQYDEAGRLIVLPIGAHERYQWCQSCQRFEWRGTYWPGKVDA